MGTDKKVNSTIVIGDQKQLERCIFHTGFFEATAKSQVVEVKYGEFVLKGQAQDFECPECATNRLVTLAEEWAGGFILTSNEKSHFLVDWHIFHFDSEEEEQEEMLKLLIALGVLTNVKENGYYLQGGGLEITPGPVGLHYFTSEEYARHYWQETPVWKCAKFPIEIMKG